MKKILGILSSIIIVFTGFTLFTKAYKSKTKPIEDSFNVYPTENVKTNKIIIPSNEQNDLQEDKDLYNEKELVELARKQYKQFKNEEITVGGESN